MSQSSSNPPIDDAQSGAESLRDRASEALHDAQDAMKKGYEQSKAKLNEAIDHSAEGLDQAHMYLKEQARERPIALTAAAIGAGVLIGLLLANNGNRR
jgi:ElaB/YqjD/DUF883 family membrane-anchored ribosome-binding protein